MNLKFKCPNCGKTELEEILINVTQCSVVSAVDENGAIEYYPDRVSTEDGEVYQYQCFGCGYVLRTKSDYTVTTEEELAEWLKENCEQGD